MKLTDTLNDFVNKFGSDRSQVAQESRNGPSVSGLRVAIGLSAFVWVTCALWVGILLPFHSLGFQNLYLPVAVVVVGFTIVSTFEIGALAKKVTAPIIVTELVLLPALFCIPLGWVVASAAMGALLSIAVVGHRTRGVILVKRIWQSAVSILEATVLSFVMLNFATPPHKFAISNVAIALLALVALRTLGVIATNRVFSNGASAAPKYEFYSWRLDRNLVENGLALGVHIFSALALGAGVLSCVLIAQRMWGQLAIPLIATSASCVLGAALFLALPRFANFRQLKNLAASLNKADTLNKVVDSVLEFTSELFEAKGSELTIFRHEVAVRHAFGTAIGAQSVPAFGDKFFEKILAQRQTISIGLKSVEYQGYLRALGTENVTAAPLVQGERVLGVLSVRDKSRVHRRFTRLDNDLLGAIAHLSALRLRSVFLETQPNNEVVMDERASQFDALTGLASRVRFTSRLETYLSEIQPNGSVPSDKQGCLIMLGLNKFKDVNAALGYEVGDMVIKSVAARISKVVPPGCIIGRLGGDEMGILVPSVTGRDQALVIASEVEAEIASEHKIDGLCVRVGASVGVVLIPEHGNDHITLMQRSDAALNESKANPDDSVVMFDLVVEQITTRKIALINDLRLAIANTELEVYYQPKASLLTGEVVGVEALLRWNHKEHGFISPEEFVALGEHAGLLGAMTDYVLNESLAQCKSWLDSGLNVPVAVNLGARSLREPAFPKSVLGALAQSGLDASMLTLEITEGDIVHDSTTVTSTLEQIASSGIDIAIDDFGTGYSSLSYLARLNANEVKIDKSFIFGLTKDETNQAIVRAIVELCANLGYRTVAEGVEDEPTWHLLRELKVDIAQGYLLSRPVPGKTLTMWLWEKRKSGFVVSPEVVDLTETSVSV